MGKLRAKIKPEWRANKGLALWILQDSPYPPDQVSCLLDRKRETMAQQSASLVAAARWQESRESSGVVDKAVPGDNYQDREK